MADLSRPAPDDLEGPLPAGTVVQAVESVDGMVRIDLQVSVAEGSLLFSMAEVEAIVAYLTAAIDPQRDLAGVVVRCRADEAEPYRLLESLVPVSEPGIYEDPRDVVAADSDFEVPPSARSGGGSIVAGQPTGALTGVVVYVSAGHGWTSGSSTWYLQRPLLFKMIEDYGNLEMLNYFVNYCFNAGATVVPFRPAGYQTEEIVLDQDDPEVSYTGAWTDSTGSPYYENNRTVSGVSYRFSSISPVETATARYTPEIPVADFYPVYTWALNRRNRSLQKYRIVHSGGASEVHVDHRMVGKGWVFLGHYHFQTGTEGYVEVSNESSDGGIVVADAIRFGNGIGDVIGAAPGTVSGYPRDEEASRYWAESETDINAVGLPTSIYDCCSSDQNDNVGTPARWAREMNITGFNNDRWRRVYLEFHTNASNGSARGTVALITGNATTNQALYADIMGEEIEEDMQILDGIVPFEHSWATRANTFTGTFGAISTTNNGNEFDATILEVAFHDNRQDTQLVLDPKVRDAVARSSVHGIIKFLNALSGSQIPLAFAPDKPRQVQAAHDGAGGVVVSWLAPFSGEAYGDSAIGYRVYLSPNGFGFDAGLDVGNVLSTTLTDVPADVTTYIQVTAYNDGGASMPSETLAVRRSADETATFLIVNGFDRVGRSQNPRQFIPGLGTQRRPILRHVNSSDYTAQLGEALAAAGATFDSCANEAVISGTVVLGDYPGVAWICGEESSADNTFNATEQTLVMDFLNGGGNLFVSGAEIGWDLDNLNNGRSFYNNFLKAAYIADDSDTYDVTPSGGSIFAGISPFSFDDGTLFYDSEFPDVLLHSAGSTSALTYVGGTGGVAGVVFDGGFKVVNLGFPFETITSAASRAEIMDRVVAFFFPESCDPCDMNCDGIVNAIDIEPFLDLLFGFGVPCDTCTGDTNGDGVIDALDIEPFLACLFP